MFRRKKRPQLAKNIIAESEGIIKFGILTGGGGRDVLTGGDGNDTFVFSHQSDSPAVPLAAGFIQSVDLIKDFTPGEDLIDFRGLANETPGHVPLHFSEGSS